MSDLSFVGMVFPGFGFATDFFEVFEILVEFDSSLELLVLGVLILTFVSFENKVCRGSRDILLFDAILEYENSEIDRFF